MSTADFGRTMQNYMGTGNDMTIYKAIDSCPHCNYKEQPIQKEQSVQRRIVCAAIRAADGSLLLGIRHYSRDMHEQIAQRGNGAMFKNRHDEDQGFVDQFGVFMSREEAYQVALAAGQVLYPKACGKGLHGPKLYSEGLY